MNTVVSKLRDVQSDWSQGIEALVRPDGMVHRKLFTDPAIFDKEMVNIFGGTWVFLLHESEIPNPNDFKCVNVGRRPVIVTRSIDGKIHALLNRCTHRGSAVCAEHQGNASHFQCPYHGWTFTNTGALKTVTFPDGYGPDFNKEEHNLGQFPKVDSYRGFVFCSLNSDVEPLLDWIGPAKRIFDWSIDTVPSTKCHVVRTGSMSYAGNWKLQNDNNGDMYHVPFTHRSIADMTRARHGAGKSLDHFRGDQSPMYVEYYGHGHKVIDQTPSITSVWGRARPVPGREFHEETLIAKYGKETALKYLNVTGRAGINLVMYPNLLITGAGAFNVYEPVSVDRTIVHTYVMNFDDLPDEVNTLKSRFIEDFAAFGNRDDNEIFERIQISLTTIPEMEWLDFSKGLGSDREKWLADGSIRGNISDETGIRGSYNYWKELMAREVHTQALI